MLKTGDFSMLSKIGIHILRHYNEIGLLVPAHIDEFTGYRYYSEDQLPVANRIQALKNMGFGLSMIRDILSEYNNSESLKKYLMLQASQKREEVAHLQKQLLLLETTIQNLDIHSKQYSCSITIKEFAERTVVSCHGTIPSYDQEGLLWKRPAIEAARQNVQYTAPCYDMAVYHNECYIDHDIDNDTDIDVEVQRSVSGTYTDTDVICFKTVKPITAATTIFKGGYEQLCLTNEAIAKWICNNNYEFYGPA